jgi:hypothetical protein
MPASENFIPRTIRNYVLSAIVRKGTFIILKLSGKVSLWANIQDSKNWCIFSKQDFERKQECINAPKLI